MVDFLRLRNWRSYGIDGKSWVESRIDDKKQVAVALLLGTEPKAISDNSEFLDADEIILDLADQIKKIRAAKAPKKAEKKAAKKKKAVKKKKVVPKKKKTIREAAKKTKLKTRR